VQNIQRRKCTARAVITKAFAILFRISHHSAVNIYLPRNGNGNGRNGRCGGKMDIRADDEIL
jgi:hypothetical protein